MAHHHASPTLLRTGEWGVRVPASNVLVGDELTVVTKGGSAWAAVVHGVLWQGDDVAICATARAYPGHCNDCGHRAVDCSVHASTGGFCGECGFDDDDM